MGTTLTGTTPQDTYDSLIKVTDNGPISGTLKALSDGLGNDSTLSLSTTAASIAGTLAVSGNATFDTNTLFVDAANNRVGIGTTSPSNVLHLNKASEPELYIQDSVSTFRLGINSDNQFFVYTAQAKDIYFSNNNAERLRITSAGNVGIGTSTPFFKLDVDGSVGLSFAGSLYLYYLSAANHALIGNDGSGNMTFLTGTSGVTEKVKITPDGYLRLATNGIQFNNDTAAANALDDYEEGTWTATITPATSGTITSGATFTTWTYTKIGRQVTINGVFVISSVASPVGANVVIGGLPFTIFNNNGAYGAYSAAYFTAATSTNSAVAGRHAINSTQLTLGVDASTVAASDEIYVTATYFV